jgi:hypothetical protein
MVLEEILDVRFVTTPLKGCRGWGAEEYDEDNRQALVVYAVYKSKMTTR